MDLSVHLSDSSGYRPMAIGSQMDLLLLTPCITDDSLGFNDRLNGSRDKTVLQIGQVGAPYGFRYLPFHGTNVYNM